MSYDYHKFVHEVPVGYTIPRKTQVRYVDWQPPYLETFFTTLSDLPVGTMDEKKYYLDYDITKPKLPTKINSMIFNVLVTNREILFPVGFLTVDEVWVLVDAKGTPYYCDAKEIESFDTTPPEDES